MIPRHYSNIIFSFFMAFIMSGMMSCVVTFLNIGGVEGFLFIWLRAWSIAFIFAFPIVLVVGPLAKKLTAHVTH